MKKKMIAVIMTALALALAGCGQKTGGGQAGETEDKTPAVAEDNTESAAVTEDKKEEAASQSDETDEAAEAESGAEAEKELSIVTKGNDSASLKVGMVTDEAGINDHSFNQSAWSGLVMLESSIGARVSYIEAVKEDDFYNSLEMLASNGDLMCWGIGYDFADAVKKAAEEHPETSYGIVDYAYDDVPSNVTCAVFRAEEPSFLVGYIAGKVTKTGKVGFIGGVDVDTIEPFRYGFMAGVAASDSESGKTTDVSVEYVDSFEDPEKGKQIAEKMYSDGCDIIFHAAGASGVGVIEAAKETGNYVIGVDCDQSYLAPENVLTSAIKKVDVVISNICVQYSIQDNVGGKVIEYGLAEYAMGIPPEHPNYPDEVYEAAMQKSAEIVSGVLEVPSDEEEYKSFLEELGR